MTTTGSNTSASPHIPVIGIVGGVGSGKSAVAKELGEIWPIALIDADRLGHRVLELPKVKEKLWQRFGHGIFDEHGSVVRPNLAAQVFGDTPEANAARADLDQITHPEIGRLAQAEIDQYQLEQTVRVIVVDAAILQESGWDKLCDLVVFVDTPPERRAGQVQMQRGWSLDEWKRREASQWPLEKKRAEADFVISNDSSLAEAADSLAVELERRWSEGT